MSMFILPNNILSMPELPEVETIVRELNSDLVGKKIWDVEITKGSEVYPDKATFISNLKGMRVNKVWRRGKYIIIDLDRKYKLIIHLRMTGRLMWHKEKGKEKHIRVIFQFSDATQLIFSDIRKFGKVWLVDEKYYESITGIGKLGHEPLEGLNVGFLKDKMINKKGNLKAFLLDQTNFAGIGNIYADEIAFRAGLLPTHKVSELKGNELNRLSESIEFCLNEGIKHNGVSVSDFVGTKGDLGKHQHYLQVYGRKDDPCYICKTKIAKTRVAGRGTFYCPCCQK